MIYTDLAFMAGVVSVCEACEGKRFTAEVLEYRLRGANIADVLEMSVEEAAGFFTEKAVRPMLGALADVGLGYVRLGQPLTTLSGGERQRIKLAIEVDRARPRCSCSTSRRPGCTWTTSTSSSTCWTRSSTAAGR